MTMTEIADCTVRLEGNLSALTSAVNQSRLLFPEYKRFEATCNLAQGALQVNIAVQQKQVFGGRVPSYTAGRQPGYRLLCSADNPL